MIVVVAGWYFSSDKKLFLKPLYHASSSYRHFKGNTYQMIDTARHSETQQDMVVYRALYGDFGLWVEQVDLDGRQVSRFQLIEPSEP